MAAPEVTRATSPSNAKPAKEAKDEPTTGKEAETKKAGLLTPKTVTIVAVLGVALFFAKKYLGSAIDIKGFLEKAVAFVEAQGNNAVYFYVLFTFVGVICLVPTTPMEIAGGFLFIKQYGMWVYVFTGCAKLCANICSVLIARFLVKDWVVRTIVQKSELLTMVSIAVKEEPWKMAFLVRGSMVPLFVKNYGLGVTDIGYLPNACCSMIFTNFYAAQNIYMGSTMSNLKDVFAPKKTGDGPTDWGAKIKALMPIAFNILLVVFLVKALKAQFKKQKDEIQKKLEAKAEKKSS
jgi:uncharacterized membrane protein YdjX (TVP38/TMEM64 family)